MTIRKTLIRRTVLSLTKWNWKHFKQSQEVFDAEDKLSDETVKYIAQLTGKTPTCLYGQYDEGNAHNHLEEQVRKLEGAEQYYMVLSSVGFTRLLNAIEHEAQKKLEHWIDQFRFWRGKNTTEFERVCAWGSQK